MQGNPSRFGTRSLADELTELRVLNAAALRQRWRVLYRTEAPVRIGHALFASNSCQAASESQTGVADNSRD